MCLLLHKKYFMQNILEKIIAYKKEELEHFKRQVPLVELKEKSRDKAPGPSFANGLRESPAPFAIIAEVKRRSPSKGLLRDPFDPVEIAKDYEAHGASALSVLTDEHFFGGHLDYLRQVRQQIKLPLLRKDFYWDPYQIYAAKEAGGDAILLIVAILEKSQLEDLQGLAQELHLEALVEVHSLEECEIALSIQAKMIGVNHRNLKDFSEDLSLSEKVFPKVSRDCLRISESGIHGRQDLEKLSAVGAQAFLIGEAFMKAESPGKALKEFIEGKD